MKSEWINLNEINFTDALQRIWCDTRDFHCSCSDSPSERTESLDLGKMKQYPDFFYTIDEVKNILFDLYTRSGGEGEWRMLGLVGSSGWQLKYIRIYKTEYGYVMGDCDDYCHRKDFWKSSIIAEDLLCHVPSIKK